MAHSRLRLDRAEAKEYRLGANRLLRFPHGSQSARGHVLVRLSMSSDAIGSELWLSVQIVERQYQTEQDSVQAAGKQLFPRAVRLQVHQGKLRRQRPLRLRE
jgi:hypothetical protein